jgi:hypothetical protein
LNTEKISAPAPFLPSLNGAALDYVKIIAALCMVIDHIDAMLLDRTQLWMFVVGRATMPLFCYAIAVNILRIAQTAATPADAFRKSFLTYGVQLMFIAALTEPVSIFTRDQGIANVLFTLALGGAVAAASLRLSDIKLAILFCIFGAAFFFPSFSEFGWIGIALPACFAAVLRGKKWAIPVLVLFIFALNIGHLVSDAKFSWMSDSVRILPFAVFSFLGAGGLAYALLHRLRAAPQKPRVLPKYALHVFYPAHMVVLWAIGKIFFKG